MWQAGREDWKLLKVAVVDLKNDVFVARLFFGACACRLRAPVAPYGARLLGAAAPAPDCLPRAASHQLRPLPPVLRAGNPATGEVMWDCDCRPSDATFLAMKARGARPPCTRAPRAACLQPAEHAADAWRRARLSPAPPPAPLCAGRRADLREQARVERGVHAPEGHARL